MEREKTKKKLIINLFLTFLKIGAFTFGGGYAMIPLIQREMANKKWICNEDILDVFAIAESTPGPIAINAATFTGYKIAGVGGACAATLGVVFPSFFIIVAISFVLSKFERIKIVKYAFNGIRAGVLALIVNAFASMFRQCSKSIISYSIMIGACGAVAVFKANVPLVLIACALIGCASYFLARGCKS